MTSSQSCRVCNGLERKEKEGYVREHRIAFDCTPAELHEASLECFYCLVILRGMDQFRPEIGDPTASVARIYAVGPSDRDPQTLSLEIYFLDSRPKLELEFHAYDEAGYSALKGTAQHNKETFQPKHPLSEDGLSWVRSHMQQCIERHQKCAKPKETLFPTRILNLSRTSDGAFVVKLQDAKHLRGKYACLSHRWGAVNSDKGKTTRDTLADMLQGIPWDTIPKTFQDSIRFAYAVGIRYLWIDSYCIIQGDRDDWRAEAKKMASVFQHSYITVAATTAPDNDAGCFWGEENVYRREFSVDQLDSSNTILLSVQRLMQHWGQSWTSNTENQFPLLTRAWVFQERLLSPRVIHFNNRELVWECREHSDCQCGGFDELTNAKRLSWFGDNSWRSAVELYTSLALTFESDRLPAIRGFAEFCAPHLSNAGFMEENYVFGLWKDTLHLDLLWRVESLEPLGLDAPRLCCCWDAQPQVRTTTGTTGYQRRYHRCQYSYSAACSVVCLDQRRLCRYGQSDAAIAFDADIPGPTCSGQEGKTSIQHLLSHERESRHERKHSTLGESKWTIPSWSWASSHRRVKYWRDVWLVEPRTILQRRREGEVKKRPPQKKKTNDQIKPERQKRPDRSSLKLGEIIESCLIVDGSLTPARLQYCYLPMPDDSSTLLHDTFNYRVTLKQVTLDFHPDFALSLEGARHVPHGTIVFLLHVCYNVYLVLVKVRVSRHRVEPPQPREMGQSASRPWQKESPKFDTAQCGFESEERSLHADAMTTGPGTSDTMEAGNEHSSSGVITSKLALRNRTEEDRAQDEPRRLSGGEILKRVQLRNERRKTVVEGSRQGKGRLPPVEEIHREYSRIGILRVPWGAGQSIHRDGDWTHNVVLL